MSPQPTSNPFARRQLRTAHQALCLALTGVMLLTGCAPVQPIFFREDGDLSHFMDVATDIEYPDVCEPSLDEVTAARAPLTATNADDYEIWDLTLEEVTRITLQNSQVMRQLGGRITDNGQNIAAAVPETLTQPGGGSAVTTYDPALVETGNGTGTGSPFSGTGVEAALSEFDAQLDSSITWNYNDRPQNFGLASAPGFFAPQLRQDLGTSTLGITKNTADGTTFGIRGNTNYEQNNNGSRTQPSDWTTNLEATFRHPLLQGRGTQYNRIAGFQSFQQAAGGFVNNIDGVIIARIRHDITLADFETGIRDLMEDVEDAYWELYFTYRDLDARRTGRDSALATWTKIKAIQARGGEGGEADKEAQARSQYYLFSAQLRTAQTTLFRVENNLRYVMGLSVSDGRLIRPIDEPTTAQVHFDWATIHAESLARRVELRRQKWQVKRRELELVASRNHLLPRLDVGGTYRWLGAGDQLLRSDRNGVAPFQDNSNAFEVLTGGDYQEWQIDLQFTMPIGFRRALSGVRHHQLLLARERAVLQDLELTISHQLGHSIRDVEHNYGIVRTNFNRRVASQDEVDAVEAIYENGSVTLDLLLDAQRRRSEAESAYYRSVIDYNRAIMKVHHRKGSLLEYNGVYLAEGPWPGKAQFDAMWRARQRDASRQMNYGFTRPSVISRGAQSQVSDTALGDQQAPDLAAPASQSNNIEVLPPSEATSDAQPNDTQLNDTQPNDTRGTGSRESGSHGRFEKAFENPNSSDQEERFRHLEDAIPAPQPDESAAAAPRRDVATQLPVIRQASYTQSSAQMQRLPRLEQPQTEVVSPAEGTIIYARSPQPNLSKWLTDQQPVASQAATQ